MTSVKTIYVYSSLSVANAVTTAVNNFQNIVATVPINAAPREIISFRENSLNFTNILNDQKVNIFTLELRDQQGRLIQLNDSNYDLSKYSLGKYSVQGIASYQYDIGNQPFPLRA